jgi:5-oxopent-3-ene-1,2,5-tricarboxylate decarboxylase / 2-hydroxyhepta-2,4-diene-1,7-dioate isomerase
MRLIAILLFSACAWGQGQPFKLEKPLRELPPYLREKLNNQDRELFTKLLNVEIESAWAVVNAEGYPNCFINELNTLHADQRMVGRARTIRYLPNRKDVRDKIYAAGPQLNYKSAEDALPGDVLVFDAGGEIRSSVSGDVVTTRFVVRGGAGIVVDGAMRDIPEITAMNLPVYLRRGQPMSVSPLMMSVDYQLPVRIAGVTVIPGDILLGAAHGVLVIPAALAESVAARAQETDEREFFQRRLLLFENQSIYDVYPTMNEANKQRYGEYRKKTQPQ